VVHQPSKDIIHHVPVYSRTKVKYSCVGSKSQLLENLLPPCIISVGFCVGGKNEGHVYLAVKEPVRVVVVPERFQFRQGDSVSLSCHASGTPKPTFMWKKDGHILKEVYVITKLTLLQSRIKDCV
jgi:hypothetical protein